MSFLNALKYKIVVNASYHAGWVAFLLYFAVMILSLSAVSLTPISCLLYILLLLIAVYAAKKATLKQGELLLSESGLVEKREGNRSLKGKIGHYSFYSGFFIFLQLEVENSVFTKKTDKQFMMIYKDAITEEQYRLLARLINSGRS